MKSNPITFSLFIGVMVFAIAFGISGMDMHSVNTYANEGILTAVVIVVGKMYRKVDQVHSVYTLMRMDNIQLMDDWKQRHPDEVPASEQYQKAMAMGKAAGAN